MLVYADGDAGEALRQRSALDRGRSLTLAQKLFPGERLSALGDCDLSYTCPPEDELHVGCFQGVSVVAASEFGIDYPSRLPKRFIAAGSTGTTILHVMHSVVDFFGFAVWKNGNLVRSLSLAPDNGLLEDIGIRLSFEEPYWSGAHPAVCDEDESYGPFPFHPLELGDAALAALFGYHLEGPSAPNLLEPESIPLMRFKRSRSRWRFWRRQN